MSWRGQAIGRRGRAHRLVVVGVPLQLTDLLQQADAPRIGEGSVVGVCYDVGRRLSQQVFSVSSGTAPAGLPGGGGVVFTKSDGRMNLGRGRCSAAGAAIGAGGGEPRSNCGCDGGGGCGGC